MSASDVSNKSRAAALALCVTIGPLGAHRFYTGKIGTGLLMLCTLGGFGIWWLYDLIVLSAGGFRDVDGKRVIHWMESEAESAGRDDLGPQAEAVLEELHAVRGDVHELAERVDFMERVLTQMRERAAIPPGRE